MKKNAFLAPVLLLLICLAGCQTISGEGKLASKREILNAMGQGLLGSSLNELKRADQRKVLEAEYRALEYTNSGSTVSWASEDQFSKGTITPGQPYQVGAQNCRQYSHYFVLKGVPQTVKGSACRNDNGSWSPLT